MCMRAVDYVRVSTDEQFLCVGYQRLIIENFARSRGSKLVQFFKDVCASSSVPASRYGGS